jgi:hypothetical protein
MLLLTAIVFQILTGAFLVLAWRNDKRARDFDQMLLNQLSDAERSDPLNN